jgi:hypothetical protein
MDMMALAHETIRFSIVIRPENGLFYLCMRFYFFQGGGEGGYSILAKSMPASSLIHVQLPIDPGRTLFNPIFIETL